VVLDVNKDISTSALQWALGHVVRKGDTLRVIGIISHILNPCKFLHIQPRSWQHQATRIAVISKQRRLQAELKTLSMNWIVLRPFGVVVCSYLDQSSALSLCVCGCLVVSFSLCSPFLAHLLIYSSFMFCWASQHRGSIMANVYPPPPNLVCGLHIVVVAGHYWRCC
jgi:hypothetical protein